MVEVSRGDANVPTGLPGVQGGAYILKGVKVGVDAERGVGVEAIVKSRAFAGVGELGGCD
jgi:hypothetical protein